MGGSERNVSAGFSLKNCTQYRVTAKIVGFCKLTEVQAQSKQGQVSENSQLQPAFVKSFLEKRIHSALTQQCNDFFSDR